MLPHLPLNVIKNNMSIYYFNILLFNSVLSRQQLTSMHIYIYIYIYIYTYYRYLDI